MSRAEKEIVIALLEGRRLEELAEMVAGKRSSLRYLNRLLYDRSNLLRWRAIEGMGAVADRLAREDPEVVRNIIRNLFWSINEESGGIGWSAPECIGEIIYRRPDLFHEYTSMVLSFAGEGMLRRGVLWAAGRIAQARPELGREAAPEIIGYLDDPDPVVRGYTLRFLGIIGDKSDFELHRHLLEDRSAVPVYENGLLTEVTIADLAAALAGRKRNGADGSI